MLVNERVGMRISEKMRLPVAVITVESTFQSAGNRDFQVNNRE